VYSSSQGCHTATGTHMPHGITQCYLPPGRGDISALTPAEAGTRPWRDARLRTTCARLFALDRIWSPSVPLCVQRDGVKQQGCSPETRLRQRFLNNLRLHPCCTDIILHGVSVSNQLQQWTNFCTNFSPKKWGSGRRVPLSKKVGRGAPSPPHYTPVTQLVARIGLQQLIILSCACILLYPNMTPRYSLHRNLLREIFFFGGSNSVTSNPRNKHYTALFHHKMVAKNRIETGLN